MKDIRHVQKLVLGMLLFLSSTGLAENRSALLEKIDSIVAEAMEREQVVGTSIGVRKGGELLVAKGYGYADLENEVKATEHTVYRIGSVTKQFTAAAILLLVERGKLHLDDDLLRFLPDYPTKGFHITVDHLLTHTSGIKGYTEMDGFWEVARLDLSHDAMIELFSSQPFEFETGERYQYNNSAYYLLGVIIEKVSGMSYSDFLRENIWVPLGMLESHYLDNSPIIKNRAEGYEVSEGEVVNDDPLSMRLPYAAGSLGSSVMDLLRWQTALIEHQIVTKDSYVKMITPATLNSGKKITYAYGLAIGNLEGHEKISHGGGINGFRTQLSHYPGDDLTVVVLCNTGSANPGPLESRITRAVLGIPEKEVKAIELSEEELAKYVGTYNPGRSPLEVSIKDGALMLAGLELRPVGNHMFLPIDDDYQVFTFALVAGRGISLRMEREGHVTEAPRVQ